MTLEDLYIEARRAANTMADIDSMAATEAQMRANFLATLPTANYAARKKHTTLLAKYRKQFDLAIADVFDQIEFKPSTKRIIENYLSLFLVKDAYSSVSSGIVVAGFGEREIFPTLFEYKTDGIIDGGLKISSVYSVDIDRVEIRGCLKPFAQAEMVGRFMAGVDNSYDQFLKSTYSELTKEYIESVVNDYAKGTKKIKKTIVSKLHDTIDQNIEDLYAKTINDYKLDNYIHPILDSIVNMPKDELASMAEALVSITALKRHVSSREKETVGGPIDVAVISKGDGFVWIKRKHYFSPELNPHYFDLYFNPKGGKNGKTKI